MTKKTIAMDFAKRLQQAMHHAGFSSSRSQSGVCIKTLTQLSSHSRQICHRYLNGEAIPEPHILIKIAEALSVSPGWLLFGGQPTMSAEQIQINKNLLHYILKYEQIHRAFSAHFLVQLIFEIGQLNGDEHQLKKIVDLAFSSASQFQPQICN